MYILRIYRNYYVYQQRVKITQHCVYSGNHFPIELIDKHTSECYKMCFDNSVVELPKAGSTMKFKNHKNRIERPFAVYADCEAALKRLNEILNKKIKEGEETKTTKILNRHDVNSCCYYFVCNFDPSKNSISKHLKVRIVYIKCLRS